MKNKNIAFRTSMSGYNKKDVYDYLEKVNREIGEKSKDYENKISALESEIAAVKDENCTLKDNCASLSDELSTLRIQNEEYESTVKKLNEELTEKSSTIDEIDSATVKISLELDRLSEEYSKLSEKYSELYLATSDIDQLRQKADSYDKIIKRIREKRTYESENPDSFQPDQKKENELVTSANIILAQMKEAQDKFTDAIINLQMESQLIKERINAMIMKSK
ncbi:MAG: DivIVA domain-containing protein [Clostridia bacterium]|nr:DivIVA domain-containing protein [Clostridia bacterium]